MKMNLSELRVLVRQMVTEAKKKKEKAETFKETSYGFSYAEALDLSAPLGPYNLYRTQGAATWGPHTGPGQIVDDSVLANPGSRAEMLIRSLVKEALAESISPWEVLAEATKDEKGKKMEEGFWETALKVSEKKGKV